jgi:RNA polymerase sigma factor (sigma-70 family)
LKPLSEEEQLEYLIKAREGSTEHKDKLVASCRKLVEHAARELQGLGFPLEDMIQEGYLGLLTAMERFDTKKKNIKFSTYAHSTIRSFILNAISEKSRPIREPRYLAHAIVRINRAEDDLRKVLCREPREDEIVTYTGLPDYRVRRAKEVRAMKFSSTFFLTASSEIDDNLVTKMSTIGIEVERRMTELLTEKEYEIMTRVFGFKGTPETFTEIAKAAGTTLQNIRQIHNNALEKLRRTKWERSV